MIRWVLFAEIDNLAIKFISHDADTTLSKADAKKSPPSTPAFKKKHRGCSHCILDLENSPIPEYPPNHEVVGVITMEDVIEELLQVHEFGLNQSILSSHSFPSHFSIFSAFYDG